MAVTEFTLSIALSLLGLFISFFVGTWGGKTDRLMFPSLVVFGLVIPIIISVLYGYLNPLIIIFDWPTHIVVPQMAVFAGCITGGFLGLKAGRIWQEDNDRSCLQCQLIPITLLLLISMFVLFLQ